MSTVQQNRPFRVIIVGAGIAGLSMSNALEKAGIDNVVLEKHADIVYPSGASIGIWPQATRIMDQIGCLDVLMKQCPPMRSSHSRLPNGLAIADSKLFDEIALRHGYDMLVLERQNFIKALYDCHPNQSRIKTQKLVTSVLEDSEGVKVTLGDNTTEEGDIIVACDGVNSIVRDAMWENANRVQPGTITAAEKRSLTTSYCCLVGMSPEFPGIAMGNMTVIHNDGFSFLFVTQPGKIFFFVFIKLKAPLRWPNRAMYTKQDAQDQADKLIDLPITEHLLFGEIWKRRLRGHLIPTEEGIFEHWHFGRTVLVGDSAHKITPNLALGGNSALDGVATLANILNRELKGHPDKKLSTSTLSRMFQEYESSRKPHIKKVNTFCALTTRLHAWDGIIMKFACRWILPRVSDAYLADQYATFVRASVKLDYVPVTFKPKGTVPWDDEKVDTTMAAGSNFFSSLWHILAIMVSSLTLALTYFGVQPRSLVAA